MKPNELMIGDWVVYNGDVDYINPIKIEGMDIATGMCITSDRDDVGFDGVDPIPLTAEILEKNGFNETFWGGEWTNNKVDFILIEHSDGFRVINTNIVLSGVHQLQHALRLCNIEKEIEL